jgi:hypothetical protein
MKGLIKMFEQVLKFADYVLGVIAEIITLPEKERL